MWESTGIAIGNAPSRVGQWEIRQRGSGLAWVFWLADLAYLQLQRQVIAEMKGRNGSFVSTDPGKVQKRLWAQ